MTRTLNTLTALAILILINTTKPQLYFSNEHLILYSKKNIAAFGVNMLHLETATKTIKKARETFNKEEKISHPHSSKRTFSKWLAKQAHSCVEQITVTKNKAQHLVNKTLPLKGKHIRKKRGIKPIGTLISYLTDLPSPDAWEDSETLITHLNDVVNGQTREQQLLEHTVSDQTHLINKITKEMKNLLKVEYEIKESILKDHAYYLNNHERLNCICSEANLLANAMLEDALIVEDIRKSSRANNPSEHLFPPNLIYQRIKELNQKETSPIFSELHEIESIYEMRNCLTTFQDDFIYSVISIPLVDYTYRYDFISHPILKTSDLIRMDQVQKHTIKNLDTILCLKANNNLKILSSSDLRKCTKTPDKKVYICSGRAIKHTEQKTQCRELPHSIVIELSPNLLLIRISHDTTINIECSNENISKTMKLKSTFTMLKLKTTCSLSADNFVVSTHHKNITDHLLSEPFTVINLDPDLENERLQENLTNFMNYSLKISNLTKKMNNDQMAADDFENSKLYSKTNKLTLHSSINSGLTGVLSVLLIGLLIKVILKSRKCYKTNTTQKILKEPVTEIRVPSKEPDPNKYLETPIAVE